MGGFHAYLVVGDHNDLRRGRDVFYEGGKEMDVAIIEGGIHFVQHKEGVGR